MKLSLITATHKRPNQLQQILLPSILAQTSHDFEWIVINDGSEQETKEIITSINSNIEIKYWETPHIGLCASRNLGLEKAIGKLVGFIDNELEYIWKNRFEYKIFAIVEPTTWLPEKIEKLKIKIKNNEKLAGFLI
ncbi:MAG: glycosyltransferase family 2 protein [Trichormus sp. ATA11-4-KO1]|jgi:glycosyltransferase involved in cell wall biosynthesis|nr:glycosyltransferase family 2 protein [Trichormus sp. ATA11-4-KO1]